jgi:hypothetical protein
VSTDADGAFDANASLVFGAISTAVKGSKRKRFGPFLDQARTPSSVVWHA